MSGVITRLIAGVAILSVLALAGCAAAPAQSRPQLAGATAPIGPASSPAPSKAPPVAPAASGIVSTVWVDVYPTSTFTSTHGCGCTLPGSTQQLFPAGTPVLLVKITLTGMWTPAQGNATRQNITGVNLTGTKFDGRPEAAYLDTADGPAAAAKAGLPWLPAGLFPGQTHWTLRNQHSRSFAAAWYLPSGVDQLLLTVDVPAEGMPNHLTVPIPASALGMTNASGE